MSIEINSIVEGKVVKIKPFGAIVLIDNKLQGLVHISHISSSYVKDINDHITIGDTVKVKVLSIDSESGKVALSIKEASPQAPKPNDRERERQHKFDKPNNNFRSHNNNSAPKEPMDANALFEERFKEWVKTSNERQAGLNKRNKRR